MPIEIYLVLFGRSVTWGSASSELFTNFTSPVAGVKFLQCISRGCHMRCSSAIDQPTLLINVLRDS